MTELHCNAKAMVRVVGVQPMGFWVLWCRFAAEVVVGGRDGSVVEVAEVDGVGFGYVLVEVVVGDGFGRSGGLCAFAPVDGECRGCIVAR
jgi:hypothetical protein